MDGYDTHVGLALVVLGALTPLVMAAWFAWTGRRARGAR